MASSRACSPSSKRSAATAMEQEKRPSETLALRRFAELRYAGQAYELTIPVGEKDRLADVVANFHDEHRKTYGHGSNADPVDIVSIRVYARVVSEGAAFDYERLSTSPQNGAARGARPRARPISAATSGFIDTPVISRGALDETLARRPADHRGIRRDLRRAARRARAPRRARQHRDRASRRRPNEQRARSIRSPSR